MHIFENIEIAFKSRNNKELKKARLLFRFMSYPWLVSLAGIITNFCIRMKIPLGWLIRPTVFSHFCGGETLEESKGVIDHLAVFGVGSVTDYAAENRSSDDEIGAVVKEILRTIEFASANPSVPFAVFKPTALAPVEILTAASSSSHAAMKNKPDIEKFLTGYTLCARLHMIMMCP
jgi:proline dehydrogenase